MVGATLCGLIVHIVPAGTMIEGDDGLEIAVEPGQAVAGPGDIWMVQADFLALVHARQADAPVLH